MRICVKSYGCSTNLADGEVLAGCLTAAGYNVVNSIAEAGLVVLNTCAVKGPTENRMINALRQVPTSKKVIVAGCLPMINLERLNKETHFDGVVGPAAGDQIVEVVKCVLAGEKAVLLEDSSRAKPSLSLPRLPLNSVVSIIPVSYGCLGSCAYCCVVFARGHLRSCSVEEVVERVKKDLTLGAREFWITSQDTASYGKDRGTNLAELLDAICAAEGDFKVRVGMMTPNITADFLEELIESIRNEKVFKFVHLPVQSGDDPVLQSMRRFYTVAEFKAIVAALRESFPEMTLSTDVICGFPGESKRAFNATMRLIAEVKPDVVNISKFFPRPRTPAARMTSDFVLASDVKRRSRAVAELVKKVTFERNQLWMAWKGKVLVDEVGKVRGSWIGRNLAYKPIVLKSKENLLGRTLQIEVVKAHSTYLEGKIIE